MSRPSSYPRSAGTSLWVVSQRQWVDQNGVTWSLRGEKYRDLGHHLIKKLLLDPAVIVFLSLDDQAEEEVPPRAAFWARARPYNVEQVNRDATGDGTTFAFEEYTDADHRRLLRIYEYC